MSRGHYGYGPHTVRDKTLGAPHAAPATTTIQGGRTGLEPAPPDHRLLRVGAFCGSPHRTLSVGLPASRAARTWTQHLTVVLRSRHPHHPHDTPRVVGGPVRRPARRFSRGERNPSRSTLNVPLV